jgi:plastocyanin
MVLGLGLLSLISSGTPGGAKDSRYELSKPRVITIQGFQFRPATDTVRVGESVTWKNQDIVPHTATSNTRRFDSKTIDAKGSWRFVARKKGRLSYHCTFHPTMKGVIIVR